MKESVTIKRSIAATWTVVALGSLAACGNEPPPPPSITELLADPVLLDATMVRCLEQHDRTNYAPECINAREAAGQLAVAAEQARRDELEAQSERKREALRRAQEAADAATRQALALAAQRETAEYLGLLPSSPATAEAAPAGSPEELHYIDVGEQTPAPRPDFTPVGDEPARQVTVQEIDLGTPLPAAPPEPEPEAE